MRQERQKYDAEMGDVAIRNSRYDSHIHRHAHLGNVDLVRRAMQAPASLSGLQHMRMTQLKTFQLDSPPKEVKIDQDDEGSVYDLSDNEWRDPQAASSARGRSPPRPKASAKSPAKRGRQAAAAAAGKAPAQTKLNLPKKWRSNKQGCVGSLLF